MNADAGPLQALFSHADDVTVMGGFGGVESGWAEVGPRLAWAASHFNGGAYSQRVVSATVGPEVACLVSLERWARSGPDGPPLARARAAGDPDVPARRRPLAAGPPARRRTRGEEGAALNPDRAIRACGPRPTVSGQTSARRTGCGARTGDASDPKRYDVRRTRWAFSRPTGWRSPDCLARSCEGFRRSRLALARQRVDGTCPGSRYHASPRIPGEGAARSFVPARGHGPTRHGHHTARQAPASPGSRPEGWQDAR